MNYPRCNAVEPSSGARCQIHRDAEHDTHESHAGGSVWMWPNPEPAVSGREDER